MIDFYCIHHALANDRKEYLLPFFNKEKLNVNWVDDFLPDSSEVKNIKTIYSIHSANKTHLNNPEISCYLKHLKAISLIADSNNHGIIIEDDIEIPNFEFLKYVDAVKNLFFEQNGDLLFLGSFTSHDIPENYPHEIVHEKWMQGRCAHCYLITNECAKKILSFMHEIEAPLDWQLNYAIKKFSLKCFWSKRHVNQRTEKGKIPSLLR
jgi:GR25 family glycosyltransferase involved in LPS biosynthesis